MYLGDLYILNHWINTTNYLKHLELLYSPKVFIINLTFSTFIYDIRIAHDYLHFIHLRQPIVQ